MLNHWGRVTHICVGELTIIVSDNRLSRGRRQAIIWTNAGILLIGPYGTNFSEIFIEILTFSFTKMSLKVSSAKWRPFGLGLNVLTHVSNWDETMCPTETCIKLVYVLSVIIINTHYVLLVIMRTTHIRELHISCTIRIWSLAICD